MVETWTHGQGMEMMTSVSSSSGCCSSYSMFTSHLPAFSDGQQLTGGGGEGGEEGGRRKGGGQEGEREREKERERERERERGKTGKEERERRHIIYTSLTHKPTLSYIMTITPLPSNKPYNICILVYMHTESWLIIIIVR